MQSYTDIELAKVLESVEKEFNAHLAKAEDEAKLSTLAKAEAPKEDKKPEEKKPEAKEEGKPESKEESKEEPKAKEGEEPKKADEEKKPEAKEEHGDEGHGYDDEDMEHMHKMYMSMSKGELKAHHDSVRKALDSQGMQKCGDMGMAKSETIEVKIPAQTAEHDLLKSEHALLKTELASEKAKAEDLQKKVDLATEFMAKLAAKKSAPQGKAITSLDVIAKSEETKEMRDFAKSEVTSILAKKAADPTLSKSDRDAINDYYLGSKKLEVVKHLLG